MRIPGILCIFLTLFLSQNIWSVTISQCIHADGTVEFTNQGCSRSSKLKARRVFSNDLSQSYIKSSRISKRKQKPFRQKDFIKLQSRLLQANTLAEMEQYSRTIIYKVNKHVQKGNLRAAYNMIAATYARLAKEYKQKQWKGQPVSAHTLKIQELFEKILVTQSTTSRPEEMTRIIQNAWEQFQSNI